MVNDKVSTYSNLRRSDQHGPSTCYGKRRPSRLGRRRSDGFRCRSHRRQRTHTTRGLCGASSASAAFLLWAGRLWARTLDYGLVQILSRNVWTVLQSQNRVLPSCGWWLVLVPIATRGAPLPVPVQTPMVWKTPSRLRNRNAIIHFQRLTKAGDHHLLSARAMSNVRCDKMCFSARSSQNGPETFKSVPIW
jgi:hypothetical protein